MKWDLKRFIRYYYLRFIRLQGSPRSLALGTAIGAAIALTPTVPLHTILILLVTLMLRVNPLAGIIAGTLISNPLTVVVQYYFSWKIGNAIFPDRLTWTRIQMVLETIEESGLVDGLKTLSHLGLDSILVMMTGGLIIALPTGVIIYFFTHWFFIKIQLKRRQKHLLD